MLNFYYDAYSYISVRVFASVDCTQIPTFLFENFKIVIKQFRHVQLTLIIQDLSLKDYKS